MARPKSAHHELRREEILDIAAQCFASRSYPAASMQDIAAAGGTSKARLYHYYGSKEALLFDLLDRYTQRLLALIGEAEATAQRRNLDDRAALHELVRAFLAEYEHSATRHVGAIARTGRADRGGGEVAARAHPQPPARCGVGHDALPAPRLPPARHAGQPDGGDDDAVRDDQLDVHLAATGGRDELCRVRRGSHHLARARLGLTLRAWS